MAGLKGTVVVAACLACAAGCSLLVDVDGLAGDGTANDGGRDDGTPPPTGRDADTTNEASAGDGGADAEGGTTRFCPQAGVALCHDFDDTDASLPGPWDEVFVGTNTQLEAVGARARSAPRSLLVKSVSDGRTAGLIRVFDGLKGVELAFDLFIEKRGSNLTVAWFEVPGLGAVYIQPADEAGTTINETHEEAGSTIYESNDGPPILTGAWVHVVADIAFTTRLVTLTLGSASFTRTLRAPWANVTAAEVHLGIPATTNTALYYDNVTVKTR